MWTASTGPPTPAGLVPASGTASAASSPEAAAEIPLQQDDSSSWQHSMESSNSLQPFPVSSGSPRIPHVAAQGSMQLDLSSLGEPGVHGVRGQHTAVTLTMGDSGRDSYEALSPTGGAAGGVGSPRGQNHLAGGGGSGRSGGAFSAGSDGEAVRTTHRMGSARSGQSLGSASFGTDGGGGIPFFEFSGKGGQSPPATATPAPITRIQLQVPMEALSSTRVPAALPLSPGGGVAHAGFPVQARDQAGGVHTYEGGDTEEADARSAGGLTADGSDGELSDDELSPKPGGLVDAAPSLLGSGVQVGMGAGLGAGEISYSPPPSYVAAPFRISRISDDPTSTSSTGPESALTQSAPAAQHVDVSRASSGLHHPFNQQSSLTPGRGTSVHLNSSMGGESELSSSFASDSFEASGGHPARRPTPPPAASSRRHQSPHASSPHGTAAGTTTVTLSSFGDNMFGHASPPHAHASPPGGPPSAHDRTSPRGSHSTLKPSADSPGSTGSVPPPRPPRGGLAPIGAAMPRALAPLGGKTATSSLAPLGSKHFFAAAAPPAALPVGEVRRAAGGDAAPAGDDTSSSVSYSAISKGMSDVVGLRSTTDMSESD